MQTRASATLLGRGIRRFFVLGSCGLIAWLPGITLADLMLYPTRVVFDRNIRAAQVELINNGAAPETYRISLINRRMTETGEFVAATAAAPGERFATDLVRYSPRQVVIPPGGAQTVRLLLRKPADLPAGEYRSHLHFEIVPDPAAASTLAAQVAPAPGEIGVQLITTVGVSIPVIVRQGNTTAEVRLQDVQLQPGTNTDPPVLAAVIQRTGNRSVYGDLVATVVDASGGAREVGRAAGVAVYTPNPLRRVRLALQPGPLPSGASLRLAYTQRPEEGGKLLAESSVKLP